MRVSGTGGGSIPRTVLLKDTSTTIRTVSWREQSRRTRTESSDRGRAGNITTPVNVRCHIQGTNTRGAHIYETLIIYLITELRYVFHYLRQYYIMAYNL